MSQNIGYTEHYADLTRTRLHYVSAGDGPPLLLLHGWPQTWRTWAKLIPLLATSYKLIMPDLPGLGNSTPPLSFNKKAIADDIWQLVHDILGYDELLVVGHDWGGPVAFSIALQHRSAVRKLAILDVSVPGDGNSNISQGGRRWHHAFHQTVGLPESLVHGREEVYLRWFYENYGASNEVLTEDEIRHYIDAYSKPGVLHSGFEYYRAIPRDIEENGELLRNGLLKMPVLALGGDSGWGRRGDVLESLSRVALNVRGGILENCGHWMPEEQPEILAKRLVEFFQE